MKNNVFTLIEKSKNINILSTLRDESIKSHDYELAKVLNRRIIELLLKK